MENPGARLLSWWRTASPRARWAAGITLFSLFCTALLMTLPEPSGAYNGNAESAAPLSPWYMVGVLFKLLLVLGLFVGAAVVFRRFAAGNGLALGGKAGAWWAPSAPRERQLEVLETLRLAPRQSLHLVRAGSRCLLIGATDQSFALLSDLTGPSQAGGEHLPAESVPEERAAPAFESILSTLTESR